MDGVALVTGGGRGLGRAIAERLARDGARVAVLARSAAELDETVELIEAAGSGGLALTADVTDRDAVAAAAAEVERALGPIELLVNNAGVGGPIGSLWELDPADWSRTVAVNLDGTFNCAHAMLPAMVARGRGRIVNVASDAGAHRWPYLSPYSVAKAAVIKLTENLAYETREHGISVFAIHPGTVSVGLTAAALDGEAPAGSLEAKVQDWFRAHRDEGRLVGPEDAAELVAVLASGRADALSGRYITVADDIGELIARSAEVRRRDLHVLKLNRL